MKYCIHIEFGMKLIFLCKENNAIEGNLLNRALMFRVFIFTSFHATNLN